MFARVEKLKYRNYPKNSNSRKGSSKSWKLLISPQSSKPTLPQTRRWISDPKSAWPPPLSTRPSFSIRGNRTPSRNTSESDRIENGSSWRRAAGRRGEGWRYQRSHRWKSRSRGSREREREREGRRRKLFSLFEIEIYRIYFTLFSVFFYSFLSLSLSRTTIPGTTDDAGTTRGRRDVTCPPSLPLSSTLRTTPFPPSCHSHL